jgi:ornithine cyclodeaminase/alanine dehydrogenase-like protein (mu-crystallin family)
VEIRLLRAADIRRLLPMAACVDLMHKTMIAVSEGRALVPLRSILRLPGGRGAMGNMPGYLADPECFGLKLISLMPGNKPPLFSSHLGIVLLFEPEHGQPVALLDGATITAIRTAAASALATRLLARADAGDLAILGAGEQAASHLEAMLTVRALRRVRLWARDPVKARAFAQEQSDRHGIGIETCASPAEAVHEADLICTVTKAREPILEGAWLSAGAHLNVVGSSVASAAEVDSATVVRSRLFVDRRESIVNEGGEYLRALRAGLIAPEHVLAEIGEVANGSKLGRRAPEDVTLYKSLGIAPQDLAAAHFILEQARRSGAGEVIHF